VNQVNFEGTTTSSLGFGTSLLTRNSCISDALSNLEMAFEHGITHFDCAKLYGYGHAERILGKFAKNKRHLITITSKSGLYSRNLPLAILPIVNMCRKVTKLATSRKNLDGAFPKLGVFNPKNLICDIDSSLRSMSTEYMDFYMLHEANVSLANSLDLVEVLLKAKEQGKIINFGVASHHSNLYKDFEKLNPNYNIVQHNSSLSNSEIKSLILTPNRLRVVYNIFSELHQVSLNNEWQTTGYATPVEYILAHHKSSNFAGITLFSSINNIKIKESAELWCSSQMLKDE
jgi:aryl-alcohol dehydrogenase-like predicted oxidoreductase